MHVAGDMLRILIVAAPYTITDWLIDCLIDRRTDKTFRIIAIEIAFYNTKAKSNNTR